MESSDRITFTRKTFKFGNSSAITIPSAFKIPVKTELKITVEMADNAKSD